MRVMVVSLLVVGCGGRPEPATRPPTVSSDRRCTLRISHSGLFVDGDPMSRVDAIRACKRAPGGAVVIVDGDPEQVLDDKTAEVVVIENQIVKAKWDELRPALAQEGVRIYVRGPICYDPRPLGCRPQLKPARQPPVQPQRPKLVEPIYTPSTALPEPSVK